jgi:creatinine amidohydrolase
MRIELVSSIKLEELTSPEVREAIESGYDTIVIALGSNEQHGPCLPVATDTLIGDELAEAVARKLGNALKGPTVNMGCSEHHMKFPGTITLRKETFQDVVRDICSSVSRHGFKTIILLPSHGGNFGPLAEIEAELQDSTPGVRVIAFTDLIRFVNVMAGTAANLGVSLEESGAHAGEAEVSLMMHVMGRLVRRDKIPSAAGYTGVFDAEATSRIFEEGIGALSPIGVLGSPAKAKERHGEKYMDDLAAAIVEYIDDEKKK